ncbi:MAG TPA: anti-sigma regulatory factor [Candidatus Xenobia bacterium]|jgi:serine/threonine-protein kinase RsbT
MNDIDVPIQSEADVVTVRTRGREMAKAIGFGTVDQTRIATALSELSRNILIYAKRGQVRLRTLEEGDRKGLEFVAEDQGPGIPDVRAVLEGRGSTSRGLGLGIPGSRRLMDDFEIVSAPGQGTSIRGVKWL